MDDPKSKKELLYAQVIKELGDSNLFKQTICDYVGIPVEKRDNPAVIIWVISWIKEQQRTGVAKPAGVDHEDPLPADKE